MNFIFSAAVLSVMLLLSASNLLADHIESVPTVSILGLKRDTGKDRERFFEVVGEKQVSQVYAKAIAKRFSRKGDVPPDLLDASNGMCGIKIDEDIYYVHLFQYRGIQIHKATRNGNILHASAEGRVLGRIPKLAKYLFTEANKIEKKSSDTNKSKQQAEQVVAPDR